VGHDLLRNFESGATAIPIDPASSVEEIVNFAKAGEASAIVISPKLADENPDLKDKLAEGGRDLKVWIFDEVFEMPDETEEAKRNALLPTKILSNSVASLIFTSGTTGKPKGRDAFAQEFHEHDLDALERARHGHHRRCFVGTADASHVRVLGRIPDAVLERNSDHISQRALG
jgi:acyl-coenzyme A synthetase/AMP-(fatty) acid ligase